eukprot:5106774-Alexandrium_andersonii.AAC.1
MSASLVGSEMCIRDRANRHKSSQPYKHTSTQAQTTKYTVTQAHIHKPVSYTHLTLPTICSV